MEIFGFLTNMNQQQILQLKKKQYHIEQDDEKASETKEGLAHFLKDRVTFLEIQELEDIRKNFQNINFKRQEKFFRTLCYNKKAEADYLLRADRASFRRGIKYWYNGKDNEFVANLIYFYIGKQKVNHLITLSEYLKFINELTLSEYHQNFLVFKMISDNQLELKINILLK